MARFGDPGIDDDEDDEDIEAGVEIEAPEVDPEGALGTDKEEGFPELEAVAAEPEAEAVEATPPPAETPPTQPPAPKPKNKTSLKKRVEELTFHRREAERQAQQYASYAAHLEQKLQEAQSGAQFAVKAAYENDLRAIDAEIDRAERDLITAKENGDLQNEVKANRALAQLAAKRERTEATMGHRFAEMPAQPPQPQQYRQQPAYQQPQVQPASKAVEFAKKNAWFNTDPDANQVARQLSVTLERAGISPESDTHYTLIEQAVKERFPWHFEEDEEVSAPTPPPTPRASPVAGVGVSAPPATGKIRLDQDPQFMAAARIAKQMDPTLDLKNPEHLKSLYVSFKKG